MSGDARSTGARCMARSHMRRRSRRPATDSGSTPPANGRGFSRHTRGSARGSSDAGAVQPLMAESTPHKEARQRLRHALTRHLLATMAGVAGAGALLCVAFGQPVDWATRLALAAGFVALGGVAF